MFKLIKKWLINKSLQSSKKASAFELALDDYIKDATQEHTEASRFAQKILKAKMLRQTTRETLESIHDLDVNDNEPEEKSIEDTLITTLLTKFLSPTAPPPAADQEKYFDDFGEPIPQQPKLPPQAANLADMAKSLSPEQLEQIKKKFLG